MDANGRDADGANPYAALIQGRDGFLYGTTINGGLNASGVVFKISTDGQTFALLHPFSQLIGSQTPANSDGASPEGLVQGGDGLIYGLAATGGANGGGTIFKVAADGSGFATVYTPDSGVGNYPYGAMVQGPDGLLYGAMNGGGQNGGGTVFRVSTGGQTFTILHAFGARDGNGNNTDGQGPQGSLVFGADGLLYGAANGGLNGSGTLFQVSTDGQTFQTLYTFSATVYANNLSTNADGSGPNGALVFGPDGALYGTANQGGANGAGTVFRLALTAASKPLATHLLWTNPDGKAAFWSVDAGGSVTAAAAYGPFADGGGGLWSATALATGPDGVSHLVWNNPDGKAALWTVQADGSVSAVTPFGPYADGTSLWRAAGLSVGPDGAIHLLWANPDGRAAFWDVSPGSSVSQVTGYGPYSDGSSLWGAVGVSTGPDNVSHLLWANPDGKAAFWDVSDTDGSATALAGYGPYLDGSTLWAAAGVSTGPDGVSHLLWANPDGKAAFWSLGGDGSIGAVTGYGPYLDGSSLWAAQGLATGPDGVSHLLWDNPDGKAGLWSLGGAGGLANVTGYGPYTDGPFSTLWSAAGVSAGP